MWAIKRLRPYVYHIPFVIFRDHKALESLDKVGEHHPRVQRWLELLNAYQYELVYRKGDGNGNVDCLSCLPIPATESDIRGESALTHPDDVDVYLVGVPGFCPRLGEAPPSSVPSPLLSSRGSLVRSVLPPVPLTERHFDDFHSLGSIHVATDAAPVSPVCPIPLSERISQRTRSRTAHGSPTPTAETTPTAVTTRCTSSPFRLASKT